MKKKNLLIIIIATVLLITIGVVVWIFLFKDNKRNIAPNVKTNVIKEAVYHIKDKTVANYKITNMEELNNFYSLIKGYDLSSVQEESSDLNLKKFLEEFNIKETDFEENTIFIKYQGTGNSKIKNDFIGVDLTNKKVDFIINKTTPMMGLTDIVNWYFIATVPNKDLEGVNTEDWIIPTGEELEKNISTNFQTHVLKNSTYAMKENIADKFKITSMEELNKFYSLIDISFFDLYPQDKEIYEQEFKEFLEQFNIKETDFEENTIFIKYQAEGSSSTQNDFIKVDLIDKKVDFIINRTLPEFGLTDMAYWYFIATVPNKDLEGINTEDWIIPTEIQNEVHLDTLQ